MPPLARFISVILAIVVSIASVEASAQTFDLASLIPTARLWCQNFLPTDSEVVASLTTAGTTLDEICDCQAPSFISSLTEGEFRTISHGSTPLDGAVGQKFKSALTNCAVSALQRKGKMNDVSVVERDGVDMPRLTLSEAELKEYLLQPPSSECQRIPDLDRLLLRPVQSR